MMMNKAWVHIPARSEDEANPFLIPSALSMEDGRISSVNNSQIHYPENGLYHLKNALVKVALAKWDDPVLKYYGSVLKASDMDQLSEQIESCAVYLLAGALGDVRAAVRRRYPGFGEVPQDYMAVNMAVPVEDAEQPSVKELYKRIIRAGWAIADQLAGYPKIDITESTLLKKEYLRSNEQYFDDACYIYPEVSANVQGFVRSRVSSPGMYLFF